VTTLTSTSVVEVQKDGVIAKDNSGNTRKLEAQTIVLAVGRKSVVDQDLIKSLKANGKEVYVIGDAKQPKKVLPAVHTGFWAMINS